MIILSCDDKKSRPGITPEEGDFQINKDNYIRDKNSTVSSPTRPEHHN